MYRNLDYWKQRSILAEIKVENLESEVKRLKSSLLLYQDRERYWNQKYILEECKANITDQNARQSTVARSNTASAKRKCPDSS